MLRASLVTQKQNFHFHNFNKLICTSSSSSSSLVLISFLHPGFAVGSIEGRVAIEYVDEKKKGYAFKCHRVEDTVYPVNALAFHPTWGTFASGGCDGVVNIWDYESKKKLTTIAGFPTSVSAVAFDESGGRVAVASSYTFEEGEKDAPGDEI